MTSSPNDAPPPAGQAPPKQRKTIRWRRALLSAVFLLVAALTLSMLTLDRWLYVVLDPGPFQPGMAPPRPDYALPTSWAALPTLDDDADVSLPELPAVDQKTAAADVFFVHPTTSVAKRWNAPIDDPDVVKATARGATLIQASAFNGCCAVYAPRYRQASGKAFVEPSPDGDRALDLAYHDIEDAFASFLERRSEGRPFVLAAHSQGTRLATRLLREHIWGKPIGNLLVAAYLIGGPISQQSLGEEIPVCSSEDQWGCVVAWNARGPRYQGSGFEFRDPNAPGAPDTMSSRICVNPLTWKTDGAAAPASKNEGALFFDTETPKVLPGFADAVCRDGKLLINEMADIPARGAPSAVLLWTMGPQNYHAIEYQLYYVNLRKNAIRRVEAYRSAHEKR